ncbi:PRP38-domain-containing protein [Coemansia reversa NRRL 1564]|uniref:Pre-mRNA-splicing factor 38 n=1 Tax=Coemansia reversa (strain ATCC 12441 / NRRL 1564) TaxID=763665 RepID=A0A2G5BIH5_COERN|nr:PRP38-domain-containing protein [Coemansia reversa NRRL 1564]|eukprot:PIA18781.1 PRP38-domain-containing protein [Coemansia reversa NRRL 1564]
MAVNTILTQAIHGTNPQYLIETTFRQCIYDSWYWKEYCFGLTVTGVMDKAVDLTCIGGCFGPSQKPTEFLCLTLKLLQLQPDCQMLDVLVDQKDFKYLHALALLSKNMTGAYEIVHIDEFVDSLLCENKVCFITLPGITKRMALEDAGQLAPRISPLDDESESDSTDN